MKREPLHVITALITAGSFVFWKALLVFALTYVLVNIVYVGLCLATCQLVRDTEKPIEAEKPICRFAAITVFGLLCAYLGLDISVRGREKLMSQGICNAIKAISTAQSLSGGKI